MHPAALSGSLLPMKHFIPILIISCISLLSAAEESNSDVRRAEAAYAKQVAEIMEDAKKDIEKAQKDLVKVLERELTKATKKGDFDEAMRLKKKLDAAKQDKGEKEVAGLFGEMGVDTAKVDSAQAESKAPKSDIPISLEKINLPKSQKPVTEAQLALVRKTIINSKTNTATFTFSQVRKLIGNPNGFITMFFDLEDKRRIVVMHGGEASFSYITNLKSMNEFKYHLRRGSGGADKTVIINHELAVKALKELQAKNK